MCNITLSFKTISLIPLCPCLHLPLHSHHPNPHASLSSPKVCAQNVLVHWGEAGGECVCVCELFWHAASLRVSHYQCVYQSVCTSVWWGPTSVTGVTMATSEQVPDAVNHISKEPCIGIDTCMCVCVELHSIHAHTHTHTNDGPSVGQARQFYHCKSTPI